MKSPDKFCSPQLKTPLQLTTTVGHTGFILWLWLITALQDWTLNQSTFISARFYHLFCILCHNSRHHTISHLISSSKPYLIIIVIKPFLKSSVFPYHILHNKLILVIYQNIIITHKIRLPKFKHQHCHWNSRLISMNYSFTEKYMHTCRDWLRHGYSCFFSLLLEDWGLVVLIPFISPPLSVIQSSPGTQVTHTLQWARSTGETDDTLEEFKKRGTKSESVIRWRDKRVMWWDLWWD